MHCCRPNGIGINTFLYRTPVGLIAIVRCRPTLISLESINWTMGYITIQSFVLFWLLVNGAYYWTMTSWIDGYSNGWSLIVLWSLCIAYRTLFNTIPSTIVDHMSTVLITQLWLGRAILRTRVHWSWRLGLSSSLWSLLYASLLLWKREDDSLWTNNITIATMTELMQIACTDLCVCDVHSWDSLLMSCAGSSTSRLLRPCRGLAMSSISRSLFVEC